MKRPSEYLTCLLIVLVIFSLIGCASGPRGKLKRVQDPTEDGLRRDWNEYTVYYRRNLALIYKIKNDSKIILDGSWIEVTSDDMMNNTGIVDSTWVKEIIGENDKMFGYLVHRSDDNVYAGILDENTVKLSYFYVRTSK
jgi:hypothetical protein